MAQEAAALVTLDAVRAGPGDAIDSDAYALSAALAEAAGWQPQIVMLALASRGDVTLPEPLARPPSAGALSALPALYWVRGLDRAGVLDAAETVAGLWASGAIQVPLPDHGQALQKYWQTRRERLAAAERDHLLDLVFDERDFEPALRRLCTAIVALADNAGKRGIREEVGLQEARASLLDLCVRRLDGAPIHAAPDLLAQTRAAVELLSQRALQTAFAVPDFYALIELGQRVAGRRPGWARSAATQAQDGALVLRWLAQSGAARTAVDPTAPALRAVLAAAERWLLSADGVVGHDYGGAGTIAA